MSFKYPENLRVTYGQMASPMGGDGSFRLFFNGGDQGFAIASSGEGWEHVSVSLKHRCPTWDEMCFAKRLFWDDDDCVVQFHPPKAEYVNVHKFCLHLWRPIEGKIDTPPKWLIA